MSVLLIHHLAEATPTYKQDWVSQNWHKSLYWMLKPGCDVYVPKRSDPNQDTKNHVNPVNQHYTYLWLYLQVG